MENTTSSDFWKKCSNCKKPIGFNQAYQRCSVTTCNHERTGLQFCSVSCWSAHVPVYRHRDAWAIEETSPSKSQALLNEQALAAKPATVESPAPQTPRRIEVRNESSQATVSSQGIPDEVLVVVSKMKAYVKAKADMNTSGDVADVLSDIIRRACDLAIAHARSDGRKTVMARDFNRDLNSGKF